MRGGDGLCVGCGSPVVEVDLRPVGVGGGPKDLLGAGPACPVGPEADHPSQEDQEDQEDHASSHAAGDVGEVGLVLTVKPCEKKIPFNKYSKLYSKCENTIGRKAPFLDGFGLEFFFKMYKKSLRGLRNIHENVSITI